MRVTTSFYMFKRTSIIAPKKKFEKLTHTRTCSYTNAFLTLLNEITEFNEKKGMERKKKRSKFMKQLGEILSNGEQCAKYLVYHK